MAPFGRAFLMPFKVTRSKVQLQGILYDFLDGLDPFTKSGGHTRSLRPEVWNFAWDLVWPIHMPYKNTGSIQEKKIILVHLSVYVSYWHLWYFLPFWDSHQNLLFPFFYPLIFSDFFLSSSYYSCDKILLLFIHEQTLINLQNCTI